MSAAGLPLGIRREILRTLPRIHEEVLNNDQVFATAAQGRSTDCKCSVVVLSILAVIALGGAGALIAFSGGPSNLLLFAPGVTLGVVGLAKVIWIVVIVVQSTKYKNSQNSEAVEFTQELVPFEDILNSFEDERATEAIITGVIRDLEPRDFQAFVSHVNNQENRSDKIVGALAACVGSIDPQTQLSRPFIIELLRKIDPQHSPALLDKIGAPQSDVEYSAYARFPDLMATHVLNYEAKDVVGIDSQIEADRKGAFRKALRTHLGTLTQPQFETFVAKFNDAVSEASQPILDLIAFYPDKLDLIENLSEPLRLNLVTHFDTEKGVGVVLLKSVIAREEIKNLSLSLVGERSYQFLVALVGLLQARNISDDVKTYVLECVRNIFRKFHLELNLKELKDNDKAIISLFKLFPNHLAQWHYTHNIGLHAPFVELFYVEMHDEGRREYREALSKICVEDQVDAIARFFNVAFITKEIDLASLFSEILISHPRALAKISCEIWETKTELPRLQQLRRVDCGKESELYFDILYKMNPEYALSLAVADLQSILKERESNAGLNLSSIPLIKWLLVRPKLLVMIAASMNQSELPSLRMLTLGNNGLPVEPLVAYFRDLYKDKKETAGQEIGIHLKAIAQEKAEQPDLDISKKPIIQWLIATPNLFKDIFATDKLFTVAPTQRISLGLKILELMPPKLAKDVMLGQLDKGRGENDFSRFVKVLWQEKGAVKLEGLPSQRSALIRLFGNAYKDITFKPEVPPTFDQFAQALK